MKLNAHKIVVRQRELLRDEIVKGMALMGSCFNRERAIAESTIKAIVEALEKGEEENDVQ